VNAAIALAVDVGGTFTDAVLRTPEGTFRGKQPTTPEDQSIGVLAAAGEALAGAERSLDEVGSFIHGMTVTTNALLEGNFARTALLTTAGFTDLEELGRQNRADLYRLTAARPTPVVPSELRFAIPERCGPDGVITPLDEAAARSAIEAAVAAGAESLAICLLFSFRHSDHELRLREIAEELAPNLHISLSHEVVGTFREYERLATTVLDAALSPLLAGYLAKLTTRGLPDPQVMLSSGGTVPSRVAGANASWTVLSGPAGGAVGAARSAVSAGAAKAIAVDMGGTSTDISLVHDGEVAVVASREIAGRPIALPAVDVVTVGAGGGSIAWIDGGGSLRVGPRSAGAAPGPAAYGHGGLLPTVTDANLLLGNLPEGGSLAGDLSLDLDAAEAVLAELGEQLGMSAVEAARGVIEIANLEMLGAISAVTVARGIDPREYALIAFGGAGPMHGAALAEALGIERVVCPAHCGVLSAWGMIESGARRDRSLSLVRPLAELIAEDLDRLQERLAAESCEELGIERASAIVTRTCELRYVGQSFELPVVADFDSLAESFHTAHVEHYGFADEDRPIELVNLRVSVAAPRAPQVSAPVVADRTPAVADGPARIDRPDATVLVPAGWTAVETGGDIVLTREGRR
jgi:N-methylhydantoinase A